MDFFKPITSFFSNLFGGNKMGGQAAISSFQEPNTVQVPTIQQPGYVSIPSQTGASTSAFLQEKSGLGQPVSYSTKDVSGYDIGGFPIIKQGAQKVSTTTDIGNIRPLITTNVVNPIPTPPSPIREPSPIEKNFGQPVPGEQGKKGATYNQVIPYNQTNYPNQQPIQSPIGGLAGFAGTGAGASLGGAVGGLGQTTIGASQEEQNKQQQKKQPQVFTISADQAQAAARAGQLQGTGQSGVFKDAQGNFYGIGNAQVATQFGPQGTVPTSVAQPTLAPFQTSLATGPISAEALLKGVPEKLLPTYQQAFDDLNTQIQQNLQQQPPLPQQPVVETQAQQQFVANSADPYGLQSAMDQSRAKNGLPDLENQRINAMRTIQATNDALQKIVKDLQDNPDFPKGLANRMITDFSNKNAITLQNLQSQVGIINAQIDQANEAVNREFGIRKYGIEQGQQQQQQARQQQNIQIDNARQQIQQYISSGAFANFTDAQLKQIADSKIGYDLSGLQAMRDAVKSGSERKIADAQAKLDIQEERLRLAQEKETRISGTTGTQTTEKTPPDWFKVQEENKAQANLTATELQKRWDATKTATNNQPASDALSFDNL